MPNPLLTTIFMCRFQKYCLSPGNLYVNNSRGHFMFSLYVSLHRMSQNNVSLFNGPLVYSLRFEAVAASPDQIK